MDSEKSNLSCGKYNMKKCFPVSKHNAYGIIPLVGFAASCFTAGILMQLLDDGLRFMTWSGVWFFIGFFVFAILELSYGFHANQEDLLLLWITFKAIEIVGVVIVIACLCSGPHMRGVVPICIVNLIILLVLICIGYRKYKHLKRNNKDILENYPPLESKVNI